MLSSLSMSRIARLIHCNRGSTTPEYAILTLAIIAAVIPAIGSLGQLMAHAFSDLGLGPDAVVVSANTAAPATTEVSPLAAIPADLSSWTQWANALSLAVVAITLVWFFLRKKSLEGLATPRPLAKNLRDTSCPTGFEKRQQIARRLYSDTDALLQGDLEVRHLMTKNPVTVGPNATVQRAREIMEEQRLDYLMVCDANGELLGLLSHYYLQRTGAKRVADAMSPNPLFVGPDAMLSPTVTHMLNEGVSCVAVIEQDRAIGMVTTTDIQLTFQAALQVLARATSEERFVEPEPTAIV
jgi:CBS domain-containing protein